MSTENTISIEIPEAELQMVKDALASALTTLAPYLQALTIEHRITLPKMNDGTEPFVSKALGYAQTHDQFAPPFLNAQEMKKDFDVVEALTPLKQLVDQLQNDLNDTIMLAGSEAYVAALSYYQGVKLATRMNVSGGKGIYDDLKKRFENQGPRGTE